MSYGYGRNDPDNWDTDAWGRPLDPDWVPDPPPTPRQFPTPPAKAPPMNHNIGGDSGHGKCSRCGFSWWRLSTALGYAIVGTGAIVLDVGQTRTELTKGAQVGSGT